MPLVVNSKLGKLHFVFGFIGQIDVLLPIDKQ